ncbi:Co-chaperone protein HscB [Candidatus Ecksteinia adelgidicola]|nr:Co-chaperone protein HscB [Candidatus Ecksteinia adelgidicola]
MDYFSLFQLPVTYPINNKILISRFQKLQRQYHPDLFAYYEKSEQKKALYNSSIINKAYQTLKDPLKCAEHILFLHHYNFHDEQYIMRDTNFLNKQLELREELNIIEYKHKSNILLSKFNQYLNKEIKKYKILIIKQFNTKQWMKAAKTLCRLQFFDKLQKQVEEIEEKLLNC